MPVNKLVIDQIKRNDPSLTSLGIRPIPPLTDEDIVNLTQVILESQNSYLIELRLEEHDIGDIAAKALAALPNLKRLFLGDNQITSEGAMYLANAESLERLDISANPIGNEGFKVLLTSKTIKFLTIFGCVDHFSNDDFNLLFSNEVLTDLSFNKDKVSDEKILEKIVNHLAKKKPVSRNLSDSPSSSAFFYDGFSNSTSFLDSDEALNQIVKSSDLVKLAFEQANALHSTLTMLSPELYSEIIVPIKKKIERHEADDEGLLLEEPLAKRQRT